MPGRHRPNRMPRRVRQLLRAALARAGRRVQHLPRPTLETVVDAAAHFQALAHRIPNSQRLLSTIQEILNEPPLPVTEARPHSEPRPETQSSVAQERVNIDTDDSINEQPDSPLPVVDLTNHLRNETCPICCDRLQEVLLNCQGRHALCGHCPAHIYKRTAKCPLCRDYFTEVAPLYGTPILNILPLTERCTILPEFEMFELTAPIEIEISNQPDIYINMPLPSRSPSSSEDWDVEYLDSGVPFPDRPSATNPLANFSRPTSDGQVQCLACSAYIHNNPYRILRHTRRCPVLSQAYL